VPYKSTIKPGSQPKNVVDQVRGMKEERCSTASSQVIKDTEKEEYGEKRVYKRRSG